MEHTIGFSGKLTAKKIACQKAPLSWRLRNGLRKSFVLGWIFNVLAKGFTRLTGIHTLTSELRGRLIRADGSVVDYGTLSYRLVTDTGVGLMADDWTAGAPRINGFTWTGCGTTNTAENRTDAALVAECTTALNPDNQRASGTLTQPLAYQVQVVGTPVFDGVAAVVEHGIFNQQATGGGVLWDRSVFPAINVAAGDSIQFTYQLTINSNG